MIKYILQKTLILAAIMIIVVFTISILFSGLTPEILLVLELSGLALLIVLTQQLATNLLTFAPIVNTVVEYLGVSIIVLLYGFATGWFMSLNWWMVFIYVAVVYIPAYFLNIASVKKDIQFINACLEKRRGEQLE